MSKVVVTISSKQQRALQQRIRKAGKGTVVSEIHKAIRQHLAGPRYIEAAFAKLIEEKVPKDLSVLPAHLKRNKAQMEGDLKEIQRIRKQLRSPRRVNHPQLIELASMALKLFGSAEKADSWFYRSNRLLKNCTPVSLLSTPAGVKHVTEILQQKGSGRQEKQAITRTGAQRPSGATTVTRKVAVQRADDPPVSGLMALYAQVAAKWGKVDPNDKTAVQHFFENVLPTFKPSTQQTIVDELFYGSLTLPSHGGCGQDDE